MAIEGEPLKQTARETAPSRLTGWAMNSLHTLLGLTLLFVVGVNVVNAVSRYLFGISPVGADELMVYVVIWAVMIAAILSLILRSHINVNLLPLYTKGRVRHLLHVIHDGAAILACGYATYASWLFIGRIAKLGVTSMGLGLPMTVPHAALLIGFAGLTAVGALMLARDLMALIRNAPDAEAEQ
ncbi:TRAP transporter small permease [Chelativorans sp.]|uniref:TRAP transporter small permease n=1 Tax=Chelativorans sp. TaxID=2203393 RepID=UPI002811BF32|nr:TRAP transporter small permease [Chelativorans sp.]